MTTATFVTSTIGTVAIPTVAMPSPVTGPAATRAPLAETLTAGRVVRSLHWLRLCLVEARPVVLFIYALRFVAAFAVAHLGSPASGASRLPVALLTWLCAAASVYLFDGVMDIMEDRLNGSTRPIAQGALPRKVALAVSIVWAGLAMAGSVLLAGPYPYLTLALLLLGFAYSAPPLRLKRWSWAAGTIVLVAGLLTFAAGSSWSGGSNGSSELALLTVSGLAAALPLIVFAVAMSSWMGFVGALAKDFSDVYGDTLAGRRTFAVVRGVRRAAWRLSGNALLVAAGFLLTALWVGHVLLWPALVVAVGAVGVALSCLVRREAAHRRRPYRVFMVTQYAAHVVIIIAALVSAAS